MAALSMLQELEEGPADVSAATLVYSLSMNSFEECKRNETLQPLSACILAKSPSPKYTS